MDKRSATAVDLANGILLEARRRGCLVSPMKLQKLCYFVYQLYAKTNTDSVLVSEIPEAWKYGTVFPSVYHAFKKYGGGGIIEPYKDYDGKVWVINFGLAPMKDYFERVWNKFGLYNGTTLSGFIHAEGTAWSKAVKRGSAYLDYGDIVKEDWGL